MLRSVLAVSAIFALAGCATSPAETPSDPIMEKAMPNVTIYHLEGRRSERIVWLMEELGLPYELKYVRGNLLASMAQVHALGHEMPMVPTVVICLLYTSPSPRDA